jgi:hypothetical protein
MIRRVGRTRQSMKKGGWDDIPNALFIGSLLYAALLPSAEVAEFTMTVQLYTFSAASAPHTKGV